MQADRETGRRVDHVERDERCHDDRRQVGEHAELLGDPDVARSRGDRDPDPDRPGGEERGEEQLGDDVRARRTADATAGCANSSTQATKTA